MMIDNDVFYLRPLLQVPSDPLEPWFIDTPVGKYTCSGDASENNPSLPTEKKTPATSNCL